MSPCTLSLEADGRLGLSFDGHTLSVPISEAGLRTIVRILRARTQVTVAAFGSDANPIQYMVDTWLRKATAEKARMRKAETVAAILSLEELGL